MKKSISNKSIIQSIKSLIHEARKSIVRNVNTTMLVTYYEIGRMIVEEEQQGKEKAKYGKELLKQLSRELTKEFGKGYSHRNLEYIRRFYLVYMNRISQTLFAKSDTHQKTQTRIAKFKNAQAVLRQPQMKKLQKLCGFLNYHGHTTCY